MQNLEGEVCVQLKTTTSSKMSKEEKNRFSPAFRSPIKRGHRISLSLVSFIILLFGIGLLIETILLKNDHSNIDGVMFVIWAAIPVIVCAVFGMISSLTRRREMVSIFLLLSIFTVVLTGFAAANSGMRYWEENWRYIQDKAGDCSQQSSGVCSCINVNIPEPFKSSSCDDLKKAGEMIAAQIALSFICAVVLVIGVFVAMVIICCGPWAYIGYSDHHKESFHSGKAHNAGYITSYE